MNGTFKCPQCTERLPNRAKFCRRCGMQTTNVVRPSQVSPADPPRQAGVLAWIAFGLILSVGMIAVVFIFAGSTARPSAPAFRTVRVQPVSDVPLNVSSTQPFIAGEPR